MSPKELMYIEDALNHETFLMTQCQQAAQALQNPELRSYANQLACARILDILQPEDPGAKKKSKR